MKAAVYARVSTSDTNQDPETQLVPLREFVTAQGSQVFAEYVDQAPAADMARRLQWHQLLEEASKRKFDRLLVWRIDQAFHSVLDVATTLERLRAWGVGLRSYSDPWPDIQTRLSSLIWGITTLPNIPASPILRCGGGRSSQPGYG